MSEPDKKLRVLFIGGGDCCWNTGIGSKILALGQACPELLVVTGPDGGHDLPPGILYGDSTTPPSPSPLRLLLLPPPPPVPFPLPNHWNPAREESPVPRFYVPDGL